MLKKLPLFIFACIAFISFLAFPFKSFASGNSFTASNISFDPTTSHISFDMSNLPSGWNTATTYVYMDIWSSDHSTLYYADSVALESSCNNSTHCDYTFGLTPNSYTAGAPVQIVLWITDGPHFDYGTYLISQPFVLSDYYVTPTPTPTATPTPTGTVSGNSFTASNISFDPTTSHISFDMSNLPSGWNTATTYVYMDIWSSDHSTLYYADSVALESSCNNSTHCDYTFGLNPSSYTAGAPVQIVLWIANGPHFDYGTYLISQPFILSDYYVTHTDSITGTVYNDDNQNGSQDTGEAGVSGATLTLNTGQTATTDANGNYTFSNLQAGTYTETLTVPNGYSATTTNPATVALSANATENFGIYSAPVVQTITAPAAPVQITTAISVSGTFTDGDTTDNHTASWVWGDTSSSPGTVTEPSGSTPGSVTGSHTYTAAGVYTVKLTVTDNDGASGTSTYQYVSVYNPTSQGLFSAGQRFSSPAGADPSHPNATGNVLFGLAYKYSGTMPTSDRQFTMNFQVDNLLFNATTINALVISNGFATLTGSGTINGGSSTYNFLVTGVNGGDIRIQITDPANNNAVKYDTQPGAAATDTPTTSVNGQVIAHN